MHELGHLLGLEHPTNNQDGDAINSYYPDNFTWDVDFDFPYEYTMMGWYGDWKQIEYSDVWFKEADIRAKVLSKTDKNHNVFVGQVGYWLPWDPTQAETDKLEAEYQEKGLNELMKKYNENVEAKNQHFADMKQEKINITINNKNISNSLQEEDPWLNKIKEENKE